MSRIQTCQPKSECLSSDSSLPNIEIPVPSSNELEQMIQSDLIEKAIPALSCVKSGDTVFVGSGCAAPNLLLEALVRRADELRDVEIIHMMTYSDAPYVRPGLEKHFRHNALFCGANVRTAIGEGRADYTPIFLNEIPELIRSGKKKIDVALIQVTPPDAFDFCSMGIDCAATLEATRSAKYVVAEVNANMPYVHGENFIHETHINAMVEHNHPLPELNSKEPDSVSCRIGEIVAQLIPDEACLQMGIGSIPDAVLYNLMDKNNLGMHTEMFSDGAIDLVKAGVLTCSAKNFHKDKIVASFVLGSRDLYQFIHFNPLIEFRPVDYTNDPFIIAQNDKMVAVNSAIQVDLTGQVCSDSIGSSIYSGVGGQVDFMRGAARSKGGIPIIALKSTAKSDKISRIVSTLNPGAGVVTSRADVHYVTTEFGAIDLHGLCLRERALGLIAISHPKFRDQLRYEARKIGLLT
jgi:acetyl-CoA hydrolase